MKTKLIIFVSLISTVIFSCKETINGPNDGPIQSNVKSFFVGQNITIPVQIIGTVTEDEYPQFEKWDYDYFTVGYSFINGKKNELNLNIYGRKISNGVVNSTVTFTYANQKIYQPVSVNIIDFYYASTFEKNTNDTLILKSGTNFLLQVTCKDSANNHVLKNTISRLVSYGYGTNTEKVVVNGLYQDTTNFSFLLAALPNITPSSKDTGLCFYLQLSNKEFKLPIKLTY